MSNKKKTYDQTTADLVSDITDKVMKLITPQADPLEERYAEWAKKRAKDRAEEEEE